MPSDTTSRDTLISIRNVEKHFGKVTALNGVSVDIREGNQKSERVGNLISTHF